MYFETPESARIKPRINPLVISKVYLVQYIGKLFDSEHSCLKNDQTKSHTVSTHFLTCILDCKV